MATAHAKGDGGKRTDPKTSTGQGSNSALDEMRRRARAKPEPAPPPVQSRPGCTDSASKDGGGAAPDGPTSP